MKNTANIVGAHITKFKQNLYTTLPGKVISYDPDKQTITAQPTMSIEYASGYVNEMPEIAGVPVMFPSAGGAAITFPVKAGDMVLLHFSMFPLEYWIEGDGVKSTEVEYGRMHSITDAFATVGLVNNNNNTDPDPDNFQIKFGNALINLKSDGNIEVSASSTVTVNATDVVVQNGDVTVNSGDIQVNLGDVVADLISLKSHTHTYVLQGVPTQTSSSTNLPPPAP